jgi:hypothetical protein
MEEEATNKRNEVDILIDDVLVKVPSLVLAN